MAMGMGLGLGGGSRGHQSSNRGDFRKLLSGEPIHLSLDTVKISPDTTDIGRTEFRLLNPGHALQVLLEKIYPKASQPRDDTLLIIYMAQGALERFYTTSDPRDPDVLLSIQHSLTRIRRDATNLRNPAHKIAALLFIMEAQIVINRDKSGEKHEAAMQTLESALKEVGQLDPTNEHTPIVIAAVAEASVILAKSLPSPEFRVSESS